MKAIYKAPNKVAEIIEIDNTLEKLQELVLGDIETVTLCTDVVIIANQYGIISDLPFNCNICGKQFFGPIVVVGAKDDEFTDLKNPTGVARHLFGLGGAKNAEK